MKKILLLSIVSLWFLASCGNLNEKFGRVQSSSYSTVSIGASRDRSLVQAEAALPNGILVYAVNVDSPTSRGAVFLADEFSTRQWSIPNGKYQFYALAYSGAGMTGTMYCAKSDPITLSGSATTVALTITSQGVCGLPPFAPSGYAPDANSIYPFYLGTCASTGGDMSLVTGSNVCDGVSLRPANASLFSSLQISMPEYEAWDGSIRVPEGNSGISSGCINAAPAGTPVAIGSVVLPVGDASRDIFAVGFNMYSTSSCSTLSKKYQFGRGLFSAGNNSNAFYREASDALFSPSLVMSNVTVGGTSVRLFVRSF